MPDNASPGGIPGLNHSELVELAGKKYMTVAQFAKASGVSSSYIRSEVVRRKLPAYKDQKGWYWIELPHLAAFMEKRKKRFTEVV